VKEDAMQPGDAVRIHMKEEYGTKSAYEATVVKRVMKLTGETLVVRTAQGVEQSLNPEMYWFEVHGRKVNV